MRLLLTAAALWIAAATGSSARCVGTDLIAELDPSERASIAARAGAMAHGDGLLFEAIRGETRFTIFGTYHFRHRLTQDHLAALEPYLSGADRLFLEMSLADTKEMEKRIASDPTLLFLTEGPTLVDLLGEDWPPLRAELELRNIPGFMAARFKPIYASMMLGIGPCEMQAGAMLAKGIDQLLAIRAEELGVPDMSLEDPLTVLRALDEMPMPDQLDILRLSFAWSGQADDMQYTLLEAYLDEEIATLWEFNRLITESQGGPEILEDLEAFEETLVYRRNRAWVALLDAQAPGRYMVAIGAAHLPGDAGVLALLSARGFGISRLDLLP